jgi:hypothetical protein
MTPATLEEQCRKAVASMFTCDYTASRFLKQQVPKSVADAVVDELFWRSARDANEDYAFATLLVNHMVKLQYPRSGFTIGDGAIRRVRLQRDGETREYRFQTFCFGEVGAYINYSSTRRLSAVYKCNLVAFQAGSVIMRFNHPCWDDPATSIEIRKRLKLDKYYVPTGVWPNRYHHRIIKDPVLRRAIHRDGNYADAFERRKTYSLHPCYNWSGSPCFRKDCIVRRI